MGKTRSYFHLLANMKLLIPLLVACSIAYEEDSLFGDPNDGIANEGLIQVWWKGENQKKGEWLCLTGWPDLGPEKIQTPDLPLQDNIDEGGSEEESSEEKNASGDSEEGKSGATMLEV